MLLADLAHLDSLQLLSLHEQHSTLTGHNSSMAFCRQMDSLQILPE